MSLRTTPITTSVEEMDNLLFKVIVATFNSMYPNDGRMALKSAMHLCDQIVAEIEALVAKQAKSAQARAAAQARYAQAGGAQATQAPAPNDPVAAALPAPFAPAPQPAPAKPPRVRRTKAQIAAGVPLAAVAQTAPQPVPMGAPFTPQEQLFQPAPQPQPQAAPQPVPTAEPPAPVVTDFAALAKQASAQGIPQFAPGAPAFVPPAPTFG